jgi:hypothetical protein
VGWIGRVGCSWVLGESLAWSFVPVQVTATPSGAVFLIRGITMVLMGYLWRCSGWKTNPGCLDGRWWHSCIDFFLETTSERLSSCSVGWRLVRLSSPSMCWVLHPSSQKLLAAHTFVGPLKPFALFVELLGHGFWVVGSHVSLCISHV